MSIDRRTTNPGRRERLAGKRHRRGLIWSSWMPPMSRALKVGRKHGRRWAMRSLAVDDGRKTGGAKRVKSLDR